MAAATCEYEGDYDDTALGYFDDNGSVSSSNFVCLAGYASPHTRWDAFVPEWREMLRRHGIKMIHMKDLMPLRGEYEKLGWDYPKRDAVLTECIDIINRCAFNGFGIGVDAKHWRALKTEERAYLGNPITLCFERILRRVVEKFRNVGQEVHVPVTFDDNPQYAPTFYARWSDLRKTRPDLKRRIGAITFADDSIYYPLQAADLLAHQTGKDVQQKILGYDSTRHFKHLFFPNDLPTPVNYESEFYNAPALEGLLKDYRGAGIGESLQKST